MNGKTVLIVEDEADIRELVQYNLTRDGFSVLVASSGEEALSMIAQSAIDLVLLDIMLPGIDGLEVCRILKRDNKTIATPIILMSARGDESDIVSGLELGADDYITKPFSPKILVARIKAVLRRRNEEVVDENAAISLHELNLNPLRFEVFADDQPIALTVTEFRILHHLIRHPGWVFTRYQIVDAVKGENYAVTDRSVDVQIVGLRKKLGVFGKYIETVRGVGYRFKE